MNDVAITTKNLNVGYAGRRPLILFEQLDLEIKHGQLICMMGPNGIGKSTLLRTLAGLHKSLSGSIDYHTDIPKPVWQTVAVVLTDRVRADHLLVEQLVAFGRYPFLSWDLQPRKADREALDRAVDATGIRAYLDRPIMQLSDGQLQMAMIARALAQDCGVIILDEPTAHLDLNNRVEIMSLLRRLAHENGKAVLTATHDLQLALQMADDIWLAGPGKTVKNGMPEDLVLDGSLDALFQFKGFDLKTGTVTHVPSGRKIDLRGDGATYLWTRNALERSGFTVEAGGAPLLVVETEGKPAWLFDNQRFPNLSSLINRIRMT